MHSARLGKDAWVVRMNRTMTVEGTVAGTAVERAAGRRERDDAGRRALFSLNGRRGLLAELQTGADGPWLGRCWG